METINCHLWTKTDLTSEDLRGSLQNIKTYLDDSHLIRNLKKCKKCGQLYFYEFAEDIDWNEGNDPQYRLWIPVESEMRAEDLNHMTTIQLHTLPGIFQNWTSDLKDPPLPIKH